MPITPPADSHSALATRIEREIEERWAREVRLWCAGFTRDLRDITTVRDEVTSELSELAAHPNH